MKEAVPETDNLNDFSQNGKSHIRKMLSPHIFVASLRTSQNDAFDEVTRTLQRCVVVGTEWILNVLVLLNRAQIS